MPQTPTATDAEPLLRVRGRTSRLPRTTPVSLIEHDDRRWLVALSLAYAVYIGIGVSMTIHWFSDFVAGTLIGTAIGTTIGKSFSSQQSPSSP